jgi:hypothetical protein
VPSLNLPVEGMRKKHETVQSGQSAFHTKFELETSREQVRRFTPGTKFVDWTVSFDTDDCGVNNHMWKNVAYVLYIYIYIYVCVCMQNVIKWDTKYRNRLMIILTIIV